MERLQPTDLDSLPMATTTTADPPAETGEYTHAQILTILSGLMLGHVPRRPRPDDRQHLDPHHRRRPAGPVDPGLGHHRLPDHRDHHDADLRQARRPLRPQEALHVRHLGLHRRLGAVLVRRLDVRSSRPSVPFQGLGAGGLFTLVLAIIGDIVSPRERARYTGYFMAMFGTSSVLGPLVGGFFAGRERAARRHRLALGLPGQRADRHRRAGRRLPHAARAPRPRRAGPHRLVGGGRAGRRTGAAAHRGRAGPRLGLGVGRARSRRTSSARSGLVAFVLGRAGDGRRRADPAAAVPDPRRRRHRRRQRASSVWRCSAASCCCRSTCRSCTARRPPSPAS